MPVLTGWRGFDADGGSDEATLAAAIGQEILLSGRHLPPGVCSARLVEFRISQERAPGRYDATIEFSLAPRARSLTFEVAMLRIEG